MVSGALSEAPSVAERQRPAVFGGQVGARLSAAEWSGSSRPGTRQEASPPAKRAVASVLSSPRRPIQSAWARGVRVKPWPRSKSLATPNPRRGWRFSVSLLSISRLAPPAPLSLQASW